MNRRKTDISRTAEAVIIAVLTCLILVYCGY